MKDLLIALFLFGSVGAASFVVVRDLGSAMAVMKSCQGRGNDIVCQTESR